MCHCAWDWSSTRGQNALKALTEFQLKARSIQRLQTPEDLMGTLIFLCASDSDFIAGQAIVVDGGERFSLKSERLEII